MCRWEDCDTARVSNTTTRKAAKPHVCTDCFRQIEKGESYRYTFMILEEGPMTFRLCQHCQVGAAWLTRECRGYVYEQIREELEEHAQEYPDIAAGLAPLIEGMRTKWAGPDGLLPVPALPTVTTSPEPVV